MSAIAGLLSQATIPGVPTSLDTKGDLVGEYQESILVRNSKGMNAGSTLFGLMSRLKAEPAENTEFNWFERDPVKREMLTDPSTGNNAAPGSQGAADTINFATGTWPYLVQGAILRNARTGEYVEVTSTPTSDTAVPVIRGLQGGTLTGYTIVNGDTFSIITVGKEEGVLPSRGSYEEPTALTNYVQTYNSVIELSNAFKANKLRTDQAGPLKARRIQALERISKDIEGSFLLGLRQRRVGSNGGYEYMTGGIKDAIDRAGLTGNALSGGGGSGVSLALVNAWLQSFMTVGSDAKLALCGPTAYSVFSTFANSATNGFRIMNQETVFGMNITVVNTPFGELDLAFHPLLKEIPTYVDWMFVVDLAHVMQKTMEPLFLEPNIQTPGQDS